MEYEVDGRCSFGGSAAGVFLPASPSSTLSFFTTVTSVFSALTLEVVGEPKVTLFFLFLFLQPMLFKTEK